MECSKCKTILADGVSICPNCGENIYTISGEFVCKSCGRQSQAGDRFCMDCGGEIVRIPKAPLSSPQASSGTVASQFVPNVAAPHTAPRKMGSDLAGGVKKTSKGVVFGIVSLVILSIIIIYSIMHITPSNTSSDNQAAIAVAAPAVFLFNTLVCVSALNGIIGYITMKDKIGVLLSASVKIIVISILMYMLSELYTDKILDMTLGFTGFVDDTFGVFGADLSSQVDRQEIINSVSSIYVDGIIGSLILAVLSLLSALGWKIYQKSNS